MNKKTVMIIGGSVLGILVLFIVILWLLSIFGTHYYTYEEVEGKIQEATEKFYMNNPEILPVNDGTSTLSYSTLVTNELIKPLNELLKDGDSCSAEVTVIKDGDNYKYVPRLTCSDKYTTRLLYEQILNDNPVVSEGSGLYVQTKTIENVVTDNITEQEEGTSQEITTTTKNEYYFKGKITNNYLVLGTTGSGKRQKKVVWQIMGIDENNNIIIKSTSAAPTKSVYDDRFNTDKKDYSGYNDFETSIIKDSLIKLETEDTFLTSKEKAFLTKTYACIGKRSESETDKDGTSECSVMSQEPLMFRPMVAYEYLRASLDENCKTINDRSCANYNYLANNEGNSEWILTGYSKNTHQVYSFYGKYFDLSKANTSKGLFVITAIDAYTKYLSGDGSIDNPYILIKETN